MNQQKVDSMLAKEEPRSFVAAEIRIVPLWAWILAGIVFAAAQWYFNIGLAHQTDPHPIPPWARWALGLLAGGLAGCYFLLVGYINRDAKRRGMSPTLWTIVALIIPNALGIILYFVLRLARPSACPQCGHAVQTGFSFCPHCSCKLSPSCPQCQRPVGPNDVFCPYCGTSMRDPGH